MPPYFMYIRCTTRNIYFRFDSLCLHRIHMHCYIAITEKDRVVTALHSTSQISLLRFTRLHFPTQLQLDWLILCGDGSGGEQLLSGTAGTVTVTAGPVTGSAQRRTGQRHSDTRPTSGGTLYRRRWIACRGYRTILQDRAFVQCSCITHLGLRLIVNMC